MDVHQCPRCELRFSSRPELQDHMLDAHPAPLDTDENPSEDPDPNKT